jgi:hypothetical protein
MSISSRTISGLRGLGSCPIDRGNCLQRRVKKKRNGQSTGNGRKGKGEKGTLGFDYFDD